MNFKFKNKLTFIAFGAMIIMTYDASGTPSGDNLREITHTCPPDTFICVHDGSCCSKNFEICRKHRPDTCMPVIKENEVPLNVCCNALSKDDMTREGLIEVCKYRLGSDTWPENCKVANGIPRGEKLQDITCPAETVICVHDGRCCSKNSEICSNQHKTCQYVFKENEVPHNVCCNALSKNDMRREGLIEVCKYRLGSNSWREKCKVANGTPTGEKLRDTICPAGTFICVHDGSCCSKNSEICSNQSKTCQSVFNENEETHNVCCDALSKNDTTREGLIEACKDRLGSDKWQEYCKEKYPSELQVETTSSVDLQTTTVAQNQDRKEIVTQNDGAMISGLVIACVLVFLCYIKRLWLCKQWRNLMDNSWLCKQWSNRTNNVHNRSYVGIQKKEDHDSDLSRRLRLFERGGDQAAGPSNAVQNGHNGDHQPGPQPDSVVQPHAPKVVVESPPENQHPQDSDLSRPHRLVERGGDKAAGPSNAVQNGHNGEPVRSDADLPQGSDHEVVEDHSETDGFMKS